MSYSPNEYRLDIRQQPKQARSCGTGDKADRRPLDPPPIIELRVRSRAQRQQHQLQHPQHGSSNGHAPEPDFVQPNASHPVFLFASLITEDSDVELYEMTGSRNQHVTGSVISSLFHLKDQSCFVFPDLSIRTEGKYRLKLSLYEITEANVVHFCASVITDVFQVYSSKAFPGMAQSTALSKAFAAQGLRLRIRRPEKNEDKGAAGDDDDEGGAAPAKKRASKKRNASTAGAQESKKRQREEDPFAQDERAFTQPHASGSNSQVWDDPRYFQPYQTYVQQQQQQQQPTQHQHQMQQIPMGPMLQQQQPYPSAGMSPYDQRQSGQSAMFGNGYGLSDMNRPPQRQQQPQPAPAPFQSYYQQYQPPIAPQQRQPQAYQLPNQNSQLQPSSPYRLPQQANNTLNWSTGAPQHAPLPHSGLDPRLSPPHQLAPLRHDPALMSQPPSMQPQGALPTDASGRGLYGPSDEFQHAMTRSPQVSMIAPGALPPLPDNSSPFDNRSSRAESNLRGTNGMTGQHHQIAQWQQQQAAAAAAAGGKPGGSLAMLLEDQHKAGLTHEQAAALDFFATAGVSNLSGPGTMRDGE